MIPLIAVIGVILILFITVLATFGMLGDDFGKSLFVGCMLVLAIMLVSSIIIILLDGGI